MSYVEQELIQPIFHTTLPLLCRIIARGIGVFLPKSEAWQAAGKR
jgi:hypothetical protein